MLKPAVMETTYRARDLYFFVSSRFISTLAIQVQSVAIGWQVYDMERTPLALGLVGLCQFLPMFLLTLPAGDITEDGLRLNVDVGLRYLASWLSGNGCVPIYNLMEDAATAEISRAQVWQWVRHGARLSDGRTVTAPMVRQILRERVAELQTKDTSGDGRLQ